MTHDAIDQSGQGSAVECRARHAPTQCFAFRLHAALIAAVQPVGASGVPVSGRGAKARPTGRSIRGYGTDHTQAPFEYGSSVADLCEKEWADDRSHRDPRVGGVSEYSEKPWLSRAKRMARFRFTLTLCLIACTTRSSLRPTVYWCPFGSVPSAAL